MHIFTNEILMFYVIVDYIKSSKFSASGTTFLSEGPQGVETYDCFQIFGHFIIAKYVLLIYFAKQIYYKLYELK
jgi:hypothetical protein